MIPKFQILIFASAITASVTPAAKAQDIETLVLSPEIGYYGTGAEHQFGLHHPEQPELAKFTFMIGHFARRERRRDPATGEWSAWGRGEKTASWIMNGSAILDEHINYDSGESVVFIRTLDRAQNLWQNVRISQPNFILTNAEGVFAGDEYHNNSEFTDPQGRTGQQQYIFYDIAPDGYKWRAQRTINGQTFTYWELEYTKLE